MNLILALLFASAAARADFKEIDPSEIDFANSLIAKNLEACKKEKLTEVLIGRISNKTSQSIDPKLVSDSLIKALQSIAKIEVAPKDKMGLPKANLVIQSAEQERRDAFQSSYTFKFSIEDSAGVQICQKFLVLKKSAEMNP